MKPFFVLLSMLAISMAVSGCGSSPEGAEAAEEKPVFKGQVVNVQYHLMQGFTLIIDAEAKEVKLEGYPAVPRTNVEIYKHGREYEVFELPK